MHEKGAGVQKYADVFCALTWMLYCLLLYARRDGEVITFDSLPELTFRYNATRDCLEEIQQGNSFASFYDDEDLLPGGRLYQTAKKSQGLVNRQEYMYVLEWGKIEELHEWIHVPS